MPMSPGAYLARLATVRSLYCLLYQEAVDALPPPAEGSSRLDALMCGLSLVELGKRTEVSRSTVAEDMRRLVNHGWVHGKSLNWGLGSRRGTELILHADIAAFETTGQRRVVSRLVLRTSGRKGATTVGRGLARRFEL